MPGTRQSGAWGRQAETWWTGYLTAMNRATDETWSVVGKKSPAQVKDMIRDECSAHPNALFAIAVHNVLEELHKNRTKVGPND